MPTLRLMSFNVRSGFTNDGPNNWPLRRDLNVATIRCYNPDVIAFQEFQAHHGDDYVRLLPEYGRESGPDYTRRDFKWLAIFWKPTRLRVLDRGSFYLSRTPGQFSRSWGGSLARAAHWVRLATAAGGSFVLLDTHLDPTVEPARQAAAELIVRRLEGIARPGETVVVTGDFNCDPDSPVYHTFMQAGFLDAFRATGGVDGPESFTFHGFTGRRTKVLPIGRIDWMLVRPWPGAIIRGLEAIRDAAPPVYPSDHFPIMMELELPG